MGADCRCCSRRRSQSVRTAVGGSKLARVDGYVFFGMRAHQMIRQARDDMEYRLGQMDQLDDPITRLRRALRERPTDWELAQAKIQPARRKRPRLIRQRLVTPILEVFAPKATAVVAPLSAPGDQKRSASRAMGLARRGALASISGLRAVASWFGRFLSLAVRFASIALGALEARLVFLARRATRALTRPHASVASAGPAVAAPSTETTVVEEVHMTVARDDPAPPAFLHSDSELTESRPAETPQLLTAGLRGVSGGATTRGPETEPAPSTSSNDEERRDREILRLREEGLGPAHPDVASALHILASRCHLARRYAEAEPLYQRALSIRTEALGHGHPSTIEILEDLGDLWRDRGDAFRARAAYDLALLSSDPGRRARLADEYGARLAGLAPSPGVLVPIVATSPEPEPAHS